MALATPNALQNSQAQQQAAPPTGVPQVLPPATPPPQAPPPAPPLSAHPAQLGGPQVNFNGFGGPQPGVTAITPQNTLRGQQITTQPSAATQQTGALTQQAAQNVAQMQAPSIARYQQAAAPYQQQGQGLFNQATGAAGQAAGYGSQAAQSINNTGFGTYGAIAPTVGGVSIGAPQIGGPSYQQGQVNLPGFQTGPLSGLQGMQLAGDTQQTRGQLGQSLAGLLTGPDRGQMAQEQYKLMQEQAAPAFAAQQRSLGDSAARFGRMGSGLVNTQLADLGSQAALTRDQQARQLALDAAGQTMQDRLNTTGAMQSGLGALSGLDVTGTNMGNQNRLNLFNSNFGRDQALNANALNQAQFNAGRDDSRNAANYQTQAANAGNALQAQGMRLGQANDLFGQNASNRNFAFGADQAKNNLAFDKFNAMRGLGNDALQQGQFNAGLAGQSFDRGNTERNFLQGADQNAQNLGFNQLGALGNLYGQQFGQDRAGTNDLRGERGYQDDLANQAQNNAINQYMQEQGQQQQGFNQWQQGVNTMGNLGWQGDPSGAMQQYGGQLEGSGNAAMDGFAKYLQSQQATPQGPGQAGILPPSINTSGPGQLDPTAMARYLQGGGVK